MFLKVLLGLSMMVVPVSAKTPVCLVNKMPYSDIKTALNKKGKIQLLKNVKLDKLKCKQDQTIDLNNHQLSAAKITVGKKLSVRNGMISGTMNVSRTGDVKLKKVSLSKLNNQGKVSISGGHFDDVVQKGKKASLKITAGTFRNLSIYDGSVKISGGHFTNKTAFYQERGTVSGGVFNVDELTNYADEMKITGSNLKEIIIS